MSRSTQAPGREVQWADGLRGIAACCVVLSHSTWALIPYYLFPIHEDNGGSTTRRFQLPFVFAAGQSLLPVFFVLTGFVCAAKPIRLANAGQQDEARQHLASSALRRVIRIGWSASCGTLFAWSVCQLRLFKYVPWIELPGMWLAWGTPEPSPSRLAAVESLFRNWYTTFATGHNDYEPNQWSLAYEIRGAMLVSICLAMSVGFTPLGRRVFMLLATIYFFEDGEYISPAGYFLGAMLAEVALWNSASQKDTRIIKRKTFLRWVGEHCALIMFLAVLGFVFQQPETLERATYPRVVYGFIKMYLIPYAAAPERVLGALSSYAGIISIMYSPPLQRFFSQPVFVSLGQVSFPLYLLHGTFIRGPLAYAYFVVLPWLQYLKPPSGVKGDGYYVMNCSTWGCISTASLIYVVWFMGLILFCQFWVQAVDFLGVKLSLWFEQVATGKRSFWGTKIQLGSVTDRKMDTTAGQRNEIIESG